MKQCANPDCKQTNPQPLTNFDRVRRGKPYLRGQCKSCRAGMLNANGYRWRARHPEQFKRIQRARRLKKDYGLTPEQYAEMYDLHGGRCAICKAPGKLCVDHDHGTGQVRGLLCSGCNPGLGLFRDNPEYLRQAIAYLELYAHQPSRSKV